ncbi:glycosyltransferase family 4 protein [Actinopolymorpha rutila]|uniref:Glycosyltransferase involved in cell wall biosynthesis n=1 Tax=Actinopolymorpha rutila TaxID=446787 RepID=A0A852ZF15_9ACTN|nr:glycosyltransferase family 4 protein [Actinopolymorpha rutila]NYH90873.1 glycosyltransferase involved in cell wall biosynthesis [Actinopolymorpha rutila]
MRHAVTPYGRGAGSSRVRVHSWLDRFAEPVEVHSYLGRHNAAPRQLLRHPGHVLSAERTLRRLARQRPDRLLLHREASPLSRGGLEAALLTSAAFGVYDFDDALHCDFGGNTPWRRLVPKAPKALAAVRRADRVIAGNDILAEWAVQHARDVVVIPSCVAVEDYATKQSYGLSDPPRLGWIGSADNEPMLLAVAPALWEVHRRSGARLTLVGTSRSTLGSLERIVDRVPWTERTQHAVLAGIDVGLMPLHDDPYSRGKCGYKLLQYAAAGVPAVGSPVGANGTVLASLGFFAANSLQDWTDALCWLIEGLDSERARVGSHAVAQVAEQYSYDAWLDRWQQATEFGRDRTAAWVGESR